MAENVPAQAAHCLTLADIGHCGCDWTFWTFGGIKGGGNKSRYIAVTETETPWSMCARDVHEWTSWTCSVTECHNKIKVLRLELKVHATHDSRSASPPCVLTPQYGHNQLCSVSIVNL